MTEPLQSYDISFLFTFRCAKFLGEKHQHLASSLTPELLSTHPFFATPEPSIDDPAYVAILILVFNATAKSPTMLTMFPGYTTRHYGYLRDSQPDLVPHLDIEKVDVNVDHRRTEEEGEELGEPLGLVLKQSFFFFTKPHSKLFSFYRDILAFLGSLKM